MNYQKLCVLILGAFTLSGCQPSQKEPMNVSENKPETSSEQTKDSVSVTSSQNLGSTTSWEKIESSTEPTSQENHTEKYYNLVISDFKSKLYGDWQYTGIVKPVGKATTHNEISEISFNEDGTFHIKIITSGNTDGDGIVKEVNGTYQISESGVKQTLEGFDSYVDNYDEFASKETTFLYNYIQIQFTEGDKQITTGIYIRPNGTLGFENPEQIFETKSMTGLSEFKKF